MSLLRFNKVFAMYNYLYFSLLFIFYLFHPSITNANQLPLIIHNKHQIFIQEHWDDAKPTLCIANFSTKDEIIQVFKRLGAKKEKNTLKLWSVQKSSSQCFEAANLVGKGILEFKLSNGTVLGLIKIKKPTLNIKSINGGQSSFKDLNNNCSSASVSIIQTKVGNKAGTLNFLTLMDNDVNSYIELQTETEFPLPNLQLTSVESETYTVKKTENVYILESHLPNKQETVNSSQITFETPKVRKPTMFIISGRKRVAKTGWQCFIRGVMVNP